MIAVSRALSSSCGPFSRALSVHSAVARKRSRHSEIKCAGTPRFRETASKISRRMSRGMAAVLGCRMCYCLRFVAINPEAESNVAQAVTNVALKLSVDSHESHLKIVFPKGNV